MDVSRKSPQVVAHRGLRFSAPENTLLAIEAALKSGVEAVEFDVAITADGVPVLLHEETFELSPDGKRFVEAELKEGRNFLSTLTWNELQQIDAGSWYSDELRDLRISRLEDALQLDWSNTTACIELKEPNYWEQRDPFFEKRLLEEVYEGIASFVAGGANVVLLSFNEFVLKNARGCMPGLPGQWNIWLEWREKKDEVLSTALRSGFQFVGVPEFFILEDPSWVTVLQSKGLCCVSYPVSPGYREVDAVNWKPEARIETWQQLYDLGVDVVVADYPVECKRFFESLESTLQ